MKKEYVLDLNKKNYNIDGLGILVTENEFKKYACKLEKDLTKKFGHNIFYKDKI